MKEQELPFKAFVEATQKGDLATLRQHLPLFPDVAMQMAEGPQFPLLVAMATQNVPLVELFLGMGAHVDIPNHAGQTPLMMAAFMGNVSIARLLILFGADLDVADQNGQTALFYACKKESADIVTTLVEQGANLQHLDHQQNNCLMSFILSLPVLPSVAEGEKLLRAKSDVKESARWKIFCRLVECGVNVDYRNAAGEHPFLLCLIKKQVKYFLFLASFLDFSLGSPLGKMCRDQILEVEDEELLDLLEWASCGEKVELAQNAAGKSEEPIFVPLTATPRQENFSVDKMLGAANTVAADTPRPVDSPPPSAKKVNNKLANEKLEVKDREARKQQKQRLNEVDAAGSTALIRACLAKDVETVEKLLKLGSDCDIVDNKGNTAMIYAVETGSLSIVQLIAKSSQKINHINTEGFTALALAVLAGRSKMIFEIGRHGGNVNFKKDDMNLLMLATTHGASKSIKSLLSLGMDPKAKNSQGKTAGDMAKALGHVEIVMLLNEGAKRS